MSSYTGCTIGQAMPGTRFRGDNNTVESGSGYIVEGDYNSARGDDVALVGDYNALRGDGARVSGDYNTIHGNGTTVTGDYNTIYGNGTQVRGDYNTVHGTGTVVHSGDYNETKPTPMPGTLPPLPRAGSGRGGSSATIHFGSSVFNWGNTVMKMATTHAHAQADAARARDDAARAREVALADAARAREVVSQAREVAAHAREEEASRARNRAANDRAARAVMADADARERNASWASRFDPAHAPSSAALLALPSPPPPMVARAARGAAEELAVQRAIDRVETAREAHTTAMINSHTATGRDDERNARRRVRRAENALRDLLGEGGTVPARARTPALVHGMAPAPPAITYPAALAEPEKSLDTTDLADPRLCIICCDRERNTITVPCGHPYACVTCVLAARPTQCPICRVALTAVMRTYHA